MLSNLEKLRNRALSFSSDIHNNLEDLSALGSVINENDLQPAVKASPPKASPGGLLKRRRRKVCLHDTSDKLQLLALQDDNVFETGSQEGGVAANKRDADNFSMQCAHTPEQKLNRETKTRISSTRVLSNEPGKASYRKELMSNVTRLIRERPIVLPTANVKRFDDIDQYMSVYRQRKQERETRRKQILSASVPPRDDSSWLNVDSCVDPSARQPEETSYIEVVPVARKHPAKGNVLAKKLEQQINRSSHIRGSQHAVDKKENWSTIRGKLKEQIEKNRMVRMAKKYEEQKVCKKMDKQTSISEDLEVCSDVKLYDPVDTASLVISDTRTEDAIQMAFNAVKALGRGEKSVQGDSFTDQWTIASSLRTNAIGTPTKNPKPKQKNRGVSTNPEEIRSNQPNSDGGNDGGDSNEGTLRDDTNIIVENEIDAEKREFVRSWLERQPSNFVVDEPMGSLSSRPSHGEIKENSKRPERSTQKIRLVDNWLEHGTSDNEDQTLDSPVARSSDVEVKENSKCPEESTKKIKLMEKWLEEGVNGYQDVTMDVNSSADSTLSDEGGKENLRCVSSDDDSIVLSDKSNKQSRKSEIQSDDVLTLTDNEGEEQSSNIKDLAKEFIEDQAELSGSQASEDEDENGLELDVDFVDLRPDYLEKDYELEEHNKMFIMREITEDERRVKELRERYLSKLQPKRQKRFRWNADEDSFAGLSNCFSQQDDSSSSNDGSTVISQQPGSSAEAKPPSADRPKIHDEDSLDKLLNDNSFCIAPSRELEDKTYENPKSSFLKRMAANVVGVKGPRPVPNVSTTTENTEENPSEPASKNTDSVFFYL